MLSVLWAMNETNLCIYKTTTLYRIPWFNHGITLILFTILRMHGFKNLFITTAELSLTAHLTVHLPRISYFTPSERVSYSRISTYGLYHKLNYFYCPNFMCVSL